MPNRTVLVQNWCDSPHACNAAGQGEGRAPRAGREAHQGTLGVDACVRDHGRQRAGRERRMPLERNLGIADVVWNLKEGVVRAEDHPTDAGLLQRILGR